MPATKRKSTGGSVRPLKRSKAIKRTYSGATARRLPLSSDHRLLRTTQDCVLRYHETFTINPGVGGTPGVYVFRANSCFDPNLTGVGHQPRGFDQLMALYQFIAVKEIQAELFFTTSDGAPVIASLQVDGNSATGANRDAMMEARTAVFGRAGGISAAGPGYLSIRAKPWELAGTTLKESDYKHSSSVNPIITQYLSVLAMPLQTTDSGDINCVVRLTYHCQVTEPIQPSSS